MRKIFKQKQKILVAGGCGFIGVNLVEYLLRKTDWEINILDNLSTGDLNNLKRIKNFSQRRISFFKGDIRNKKDVEKAIKGCDFLVNLAAQTGVIPSLKKPLEGAEINILGAINLLEAAKKKGVRKFIHASSGAALGDQETPLDEKKIPLPLSPYGASKLAGEGYCSAYSDFSKLKTVALRFSNVYGPLANLKESVVPKFIKQVLKGKPLTIYGDGKQTRDFIYVDDVCQALLLTLRKELPNNFELFQLGTNKETSINDLYKIIKKEFEKRNYKIKKAVFKKEKKGEIRRNYANISKAKRLLGFRPATDLKKGIAKTADWFKNFERPSN